MQSVAQKIEAKYMKHAVVDVKTGDTVRVSQKIREGNKERVQMFEGLVIRTDLTYFSGNICLSGFVKY
jgi:large subunit ribosomal protein L19